MNLERFDLAPLEMERFQVREVLRCILHTIIFNRALASIVPREVDCDVLEVSYVRLFGISYT